MKSLFAILFFLGLMQTSAFAQSRPGTGGDAPPTANSMSLATIDQKIANAANTGTCIKRKNFNNMLEIYNHFNISEVLIKTGEECEEDRNPACLFSTNSSKELLRQLVSIGQPELDSYLKVKYELTTSQSEAVTDFYFRIIAKLKIDVPR